MKLLVLRRKNLNRPNALYLNDFFDREKKQVVELKYFALGEISEEEYALLVHNDAHGFSTFMSWFILEAIASRGELIAINTYEVYYGGMLAAGATMFFEDFNLK